MTIGVRIYEDLQCSDCARFQRMLDEELLPEYGALAQFEHRAFPLPKHPAARAAAVAAQYFHEIDPELGGAFRRTCLARTGELTPENLAKMVREFAVAHQQDGAKAEAALEDQELAAKVENEYREGVALGITHTPTIFVNGGGFLKVFVESFTAAEISQAIQAALASGAAPESQ